MENKQWLDFLQECEIEMEKRMHEEWIEKKKKYEAQKGWERIINKMNKENSVCCERKE